MTVTRYRKQVSPDALRDAILGVTRTKKEPTPADAAAPAEPAKAAERAPMKISREVMARAKRRRPTIAMDPNGDPATPMVRPFVPYRLPPGVGPEKGGKAQLAMDSSLESWAQDSFLSAAMTNPSAAFIEGVAFLGYAYLSELTQRPEYRRISERLATEMTRKWITLNTAGEADDQADDDADDKKDDDDPDGAKDAALEEDDQDPDQEDDDDEPLVDEAQKKRNEALQLKLKEIGEDLVTYKVRDLFRKVAEHDGWFGRAHIYIDTGDGDDPNELKSDLGNGNDEATKAKFGKGDLRGFKAIEPIWCYPVNYNASDPLSDDWYNPQVWFVMSKQVHLSRLLTFVGREVPDILKPAYAFGGLSMSQMAKPYVDNWLRTRQAVTNLIESFSVSGVYTNAQSILQGGGEEVLDRIELFNVTRTNSGTMVLDKEQEEFFNVSTPLGTLDHLQAQSQEQMSSVSGLPLIVLLGITPTGLNASSEGELRTFYDLVHAMQESFFREKLTRVLNFIQLNRYGEIDPAIGFDFEPLWSLDEKGQAEVDKIKAETHTVYVDGGVISPEEVRKIIIADPGLPYTGLDPNDIPEPPAEEGLIGPGAGSGGDGPEGAGGNEQSDAGGAAEDEATGEIVEVAPDIFAMEAREHKPAAEKAAAEKKQAEAAAKKKEQAEAAEKAKKEKMFAEHPEMKEHYEAIEAITGGGEAANNYIKAAQKQIKSAGFSDKIRPEEAVAIIAYSGSHYAKLNDELRAGTMSMSQFKFMKSLNAGLDKLPPHTQPTFRRASLSPEAFAIYKKGMVAEERGFMSTSKNQGTWAGSHTFEIHGKTGRDISQLSSHPHEAEVLFKSGSRFFVKDVKGTHIVLEEI